MGPISAKSTHKSQRWIATAELTVACSVTGTPAVAVIGVTGLIVGLANAAIGINRLQVARSGTMRFIMSFIITKSPPERGF